MWIYTLAEYNKSLKSPNFEDIVSTAAAKYNAQKQTSINVPGYDKYIAAINGGQN